MKTIRVYKHALVAAIEQNHAKHIAEFDAAIAHDQLADDDGVPGFRIGDYIKPKPDSHADDYSRALAKLALSADDVIELDDTEYRQFVEDDWAWQRSFKAITTSYLGGAQAQGVGAGNGLLF